MTPGWSPQQISATLKARVFPAAPTHITTTRSPSVSALASWPDCQQIGEDLLPVEVDRTPGRPPIVSMDQSPPVFGHTVDDLEELASALGLSGADIDAGRPAQVGSTGARHLLVPLRDRSAVDAAVPDSARLAAVLRKVGGEGCYIYSLDPVDPADAVAYCRFFNPTMGIHEDPPSAPRPDP